MLGHIKYLHTILYGSFIQYFGTLIFYNRIFSNTYLQSIIQDWFNYLFQIDALSNHKSAMRRATGKLITFWYFYLTHNYLIVWWVIWFNFHFCFIKFGILLLGELTIRSVERTLEKEINRIENVRHANKNLDNVTL